MLKRSTNVIRGQLPVEKVNGIPTNGYSNISRTPISNSRGLGISSYSKTSITPSTIRGPGMHVSRENVIGRSSKSPLSSRGYNVSSGIMSGGRSIIGSNVGEKVHTFQSPHNISTVKDFRGTIMGTDSQLKSATFTQNSGAFISNASLSPSSRINRSPIGRKLVGGIIGTSNFGGRSNFSGTVSRTEKTIMRLEDGREINKSTLEAMMRPTSRRLPTRSVLEGTVATSPIQTVGGMRTVNSGKLLLSTSTDKNRGIRVTKEIKVTNFGTTNYAPSTITGSARRSGPIVNSGNYFDRVAAERSTSRTRVMNGGSTIGSRIPAPTTRSIAQNSRTITNFSRGGTTSKIGTHIANRIGNTVASGINNTIINNITGKSIATSVIGTGVSTTSILGSSLKTTPGVMNSAMRGNTLETGTTITSNPYITKRGDVVASAAVGR